MIPPCDSSPSSSPSSLSPSLPLERGLSRRARLAAAPRPFPPPTARTLAGPVQLWAKAGAGWLGGPSEFRQRYQAGLGLGLSGDRRFANRFALRGRVDFTDLPSTQPTTVLIGGIAYAVSSDYGHGWFGSSTAGGAIRVWNRLWLDGAAGVAYFRNGFSTGDTFEDLSTGRLIPIEAGTGWGSVWSSALRYEFQPTRRDRVLAEFEFATMNRNDVLLRFCAIRFGYRAF
jgi:hypothetical protein